MEHDPATLRQMREATLTGHEGRRKRREGRLIYPEAVAIGLIWAASVAGGIQALTHLLG